MENQKEQCPKCGCSEFGKGRQAGDAGVFPLGKFIPLRIEMRFCNQSRRRSISIRNGSTYLNNWIGGIPCSILIDSMNSGFTTLLSYLQFELLC